MDHDFEEEGLHAFQGRGATELDVLEGAVTNTGKESYVVGSLQLSPGIPPYFRPPMFGFPTKEGAGSWYVGLKFGERGTPNNGWYGPPWGSGCPTGCPDALSGGLTELDDLDTRYWTYRMEWFTGPEGHISWYYDNEFVWGLTAASFSDYKVCSEAGGIKTCKRTPERMIPQEPMSLVMNTAIGTWNGGITAMDNLHWPAVFFVDYVRVWQQTGEINVGCNPPDFPTKKYIEKNAWAFGEMVAPLGYDTCPEIYPKSAYENAAAIKARAATLRANTMTGATVAAAPTVLTALNAMPKVDSASAEAKSGLGVSAPLFAIGSVALLVAGYIWHSSKASSYTPSALSSMDEGELDGDYQLAR